MIVDAGDGQAGLDHRRHQRGEGDPVALQGLDHPGGVETTVDHEAPAAGHAVERGDHGGGMEQRRHDEPAVAHVDTGGHAGGDLGTVGQHGAVRQDHALRGPGRAARIHLVERGVGARARVSGGERIAVDPPVPRHPTLGGNAHRHPHRQVDRVAHRGRDLGVGHQSPRAAVGEHEGDFRRSEPGVERHRHRPDHRRCVVHDRVLHGVRPHEGEPVARAHSRAEERSGRPPSHVERIAVVGHRPRTVDREHQVGPGPGMELEDVVQQHRD